MLSALPPNTNAVVLSVPDEENLLKIDRKLSIAGLPHALIREVDPPFHGQATAIGLVPTNERQLIRPHLSCLPLFGKKFKLQGTTIPKPDKSTALKAQPGAPCPISSAAEREE